MLCGSQSQKETSCLLSALVPNYPHHPATLNIVLIIPKKKGGGIFVGLLLSRGKIWKRQVGPHGRPSQEELQRIISVSIPSIFNWV